MQAVLAAAALAGRRPARRSWLLCWQRLPWWDLGLLWLVLLGLPVASCLLLWRDLGQLLAVASCLLGLPWQQGLVSWPVLVMRHGTGPVTGLAWHGAQWHRRPGALVVRIRTRNSLRVQLAMNSQTSIRRCCMLRVLTRQSTHRLNQQFDAS